ncbi:MAG TPA: M20/M25/M40 family metallo-hydrolase [Bacteroidetes bacterium]|nr:M20/M25/M40 family metallo-hydrolase [Bacteroidota bacterium]
MKDSLVETLFNLIKLDGQSRAERPVADFIGQKMKALGYRVEEDLSANSVDGNTGNLLCFPPHFRADRPAMMLAAHMDTVRPAWQAQPVVQDNVIRSDNNHAIGVDNRAGCTVLSHAADYLLRQHAQEANIMFVFTVCEEIGSKGAKELAVPANVIMGTVFDCSARPGTFIQSTFGAKQFTLEIHGKSAHAGVDPEKGINAILLASNIIAGLPVGRVSPDLTCNVAKISGGGPINVVPDYVRVDGEIRGSDREQISSMLQRMKELGDKVCQISGGMFSLSTESHFSPYRIDENSQIFQLVFRVLSSSGLTPNPIHYPGGSDANVFNEKGLPSINVGIGAQRPHSGGEFIFVEDLIASYNIATKLVDEFSAANW